MIVKGEKMMNETYTDECLYKDTYLVISMMNEEMRSKINSKFISFLEENMDVTYRGTIDNTVPLSMQNIPNNLKVMISILYADYFCDDEQKVKIRENEKYIMDNINNVFKKREKFNNIPSSKNEKQTEVEENKDMIIYKEKNIFQKIFYRIKLFLKKIF